MTQTSTDNSSLRTLSNQMADAVERIQSTLVQVHGRERQSATGIVFAEDLVLTAHHVLERENGITIQTADGRKLSAQLVGRDAETDLALLRVEKLGIAAATPAPDAARIGQLVLAVGRTDEGPMASVGIVSMVGGPLRTGRRTLLEKYIQTDAISYPGFSGGALVDVQGQVVGMLTTGLLNGVPLAIPLQTATTIVNALRTQGTVKRGYLGISSQLVNLPPAQRRGQNQEHGLLLVNIEENSPAQQGGLLLGDILLSLDGHTLQDAEDLPLLLTPERVNKAIPVELIRGGNVQTLQVTVGARN